MDDKFNNEQKLQQAFLKTFPSNLAIAADSDHKFPYFMLLNSSELVKLHGSSVLTAERSMPELVCCQTLVVSTVTGRTMTKCLIPISKEVFELDQKLYELYSKKKKNIGISKKVEIEQPTAVLRYLRGKNQNEYIQNKLKENEAYLETDEDSEKILYYYLVKRSNAQTIVKIDEMAKKIGKHTNENIFKRNYLAPVSDKCKLHVDEYGKVVDVMDAREFISFIVKSTGKEVYDHIVSVCKKMNLHSKDLQITKNKKSDVIFVHLKDKIIAKALFNLCKKFIVLKKQISSSLKITSVSYMRIEQEQLCW
jgi:hypothetical protein